MISNKLKTYIALSMPVFLSHGLEEYFTNFYVIDSFSRFVFHYFEHMSSLQATFLLFQIMIAVLLTTSYLILRGGKWILALTIFLGLIFLFELHHLVKAILVQGYYPGLATAFVLYVLGYFYWKELLINLKRT